MSDRGTRIFLGICIIVPFVIYCVYYYSSMISNAAYRFSDFEYLQISYGEPDSMLNEYNSQTRRYQFVLRDGTIKVDTVILREDDLLYLHRKAQTLGFWNVDRDMTTPDADRSDNSKAIPPRYDLEFVYKEKSKRVILDADFSGNQKMKDAAKSTIDEVLRILADAQKR